jgi:hypothetical protein
MGNAYSFRVNQHASSYDQMQIGGHSNVTGYQGGISMNAGSSTDGRMMFGSNANEIRHDERIARLQEIVNEAPRLQLRVSLKYSLKCVGSQLCLLRKG